MLLTLKFFRKTILNIIARYLLLNVNQNMKFRNTIVFKFNAVKKHRTYRTPIFEVKQKTKQLC